MNYIELFAGCGGLSLGLDSIEFKMLLANELSPMAAETFAYNHLGENLRSLASEPKYTKWLSSNFRVDEMEQRLREDPRSFPEYNADKCDFVSAKSLEGCLLVGSIITLNKWLDSNQSDLNLIKNGFGTGGVDIVSGGPPCQSFSMAGMRELSNNRNTLPWEFAKFVQKVEPKVAILENVTGILKAFKENGKSYYAWLEVAKAFAEVGYIPLCLHINAKFVGVAQNRPRFILLAVRKNIFDELESNFNEAENILFASSKLFYEKVKSKQAVDTESLSYFDATKDDFDLYKKSFLKYLVSGYESNINVKDAIDDLRDESVPLSDYVVKVNDYFKIETNDDEKKINHDYRNNKDHVKRRFNIYQILNTVPNSTVREVRSLLRSDIDQLSSQAADDMLNKYYLTHENAYEKLGSKRALESYLIRHRTRKQTQKALKADKPAPAAMSIPDDACHYHPRLVRTLTVREMARIQSFPDSFVFRSKITTGGDQRRFEVPQYTQVGNAVPPLLGRALGRCVKELLKGRTKEIKKQ